jgi:hypothetical protein
MAKSSRQTIGVSGGSGRWSATDCWQRQMDAASDAPAAAQAESVSAELTEDRP